MSADICLLQSSAVQQSPTNIDVEHLLTCLLAICIVFGETSIKSSAHFLISLFVFVVIELYELFFLFCFVLFCFVFCHSMVAPTAFGGSQARGQIGAVAAGLCQSHSNARSEPHLRPIPQLTATPDP